MTPDMYMRCLLAVDEEKVAKCLVQNRRSRQRKCMVQNFCCLVVVVLPDTKVELVFKLVHKFNYRWHFLFYMPQCLKLSELEWIVQTTV